MNRTNANNPFSEAYRPEESDAELVTAIQGGDQAALERLILRHQAWIYNIAVKMVCSTADAQDVTQEVLVKILTRLSTFRGESEFRTWLYRIVTNHILNLQRRPVEAAIQGFAAFVRDLDAAPEMQIPDRRAWPEEAALVAEAQVGCMSAMLLCLDRRQRLAYILGEILAVNQSIAADVMELTPANFRQLLGRAREQLHNFMNQKCGLVNKNNPCRCAKKTAAFIERGYVNPENLEFHEGYVNRIRERVADAQTALNQTVDDSYRALYREHPFLEGAAVSRRVLALIRAPDFRKTFAL